MPIRRLPAAVRWLLAVTAVLFLAAAVAFTYITRQSPLLRDRVVAALNGRFQSQVQLASLQVSVFPGTFPGPGVNGTDLELRHDGRTDVPPLISIHKFSGSAPLTGLFQSPLHLGTVTLEGLNIQVPAGGMKLRDTDEPRSKKGPSLVIDRIEAASAWLELASKNPLKPPRIFDIHQLVMTGFRPDAAAAFHASLTNPIPEGEVHTEGTFGPWSAGQPSQTPIQGTYTFDKANLNDIKGLSGTLSSIGQYDGTLERIAVRGDTISPNFAIDVANQPVPLTTRFTAVVDGTNGDTFLEQVQATLINTVIIARGAVVRAKDVKGRQTTLDVTIADGRIEDLLKLAMKPGKTPLTGRIAIKTRLVIPADKTRSVVDKMALDGAFSLTEARFTNFNVQKKLNVLSKKARGDEGSDDAESVVSNVSGRFVMRDAAINFSSLAFSLPGARVELVGSYGLRTETVSFTGNLLLDSSLADTTSGIKAVAARLVQPFFKRPGGGSRIPIRISGPRAKPAFGLDLKKAFLPS